MADEILEAAQFATSVGMKMPLFMAEISSEGDYAYNWMKLAVEQAGILLYAKNVGYKHTLKSRHCKTLSVKLSHYTFYNEITYHARSAGWIRNRDISIKDKKLKDKELRIPSNIKSEIESRFSEYALTNYEEYIAEFAAVVLCCLQNGRNPFQVITDTKLWRLYYEFGGPDFAPIIKEKGFLPSGYNKKCDILLNKECDWCSGYPSKFNIDVNNLSDKNVFVADGSSTIVYRLVPITSKTILPPPPIGYCYTTERGSIELKHDDRLLEPDGKYYTPKFCSLTNGPLSFVSATDSSDPESEVLLPHHFELLK